MFAIYRPLRSDMPLTWHLLCLLGLLPFCLLALSSGFDAAQPTSSSTLLGGWASGLSMHLPLLCCLLLLFAGWLRLGPARLLATLVLGTLAVQIMLHRGLPALLVSDGGLTVALLVVCSITALWLLPAAPLSSGRPAWIAATVLLLIGGGCAWLLWLKPPALPPCSFDPHGGRQLSLCLGVALR